MSGNLLEFFHFCLVPALFSVPLLTEMKFQRNFFPQKQGRDERMQEGYPTSAKLHSRCLVVFLSSFIFALFLSFSGPSLTEMEFQRIFFLQFKMIKAVCFEECIDSICKRSIATCRLYMYFLFCFPSHACTFGMKCCVDMLQIPGVGYMNILNLRSC